MQHPTTPYRLSTFSQGRLLGIPKLSLPTPEAEFYEFLQFGNIHPTHTRAPRRKNPPNNTLVCARLNLYIRDMDDDTNTDTHEDNAQYGLLYCPTSQTTTENVTSQADYALACQRHASTHIRTCTHAHMHMCVHKHV